jgi:outer membrane protein assembly factor BamB
MKMTFKLLLLVLVAPIASGSPPTPKPTPKGGEILYYSTNYALQAFSATNGKLIWNHSMTRQHLRELTISPNGKMLFETHKTHLRAVDAGSGKPLWMVMNNSVGAADSCLSSVVTPDSSLIFWAVTRAVGNPARVSSTVQARSTRDGELKWNYPFAQCSNIAWNKTFSRMLISADAQKLLVFCWTYNYPDEDGQVHVQALDISDGKTSWSATLPGSASKVVVDPKAGVAGSFLYLAGKGSQEPMDHNASVTVNAIDMSSGKKLWSTESISLRSFAYQTPFLLSPFALSDDGETLVCVLDTMIYLGDSALMAISLKGRGSAKWYTPGNTVPGASVSANEGPNEAVTQPGMSPFNGDAMFIGAQMSTKSGLTRVSLSDGSVTNHNFTDCNQYGHCGADGNLVLSADGRLGFGSFFRSKKAGNVLVAFDTVTGEAVWKVQLPRTEWTDGWTEFDPVWEGPGRAMAIGRHVSSEVMLV